MGISSSRSAYNVSTPAIHQNSMDAIYKFFTPAAKDTENNKWSDGWFGVTYSDDNCIWCFSVAKTLFNDRYQLNVVSNSNPWGDDYKNS